MPGSATSDNFLSDAGSPTSQRMLGPPYAWFNVEQREGSSEGQLNFHAAAPIASRLKRRDGVIQRENA